MYKWKYEMPEGFSNMLMNSDGEYLTGLWFEGKIVRTRRFRYE